MKRIIKIIIFCTCFFYWASGYSQRNWDKVEQLRIAFISKRLNLTASESDKFWPVYNEYNEKMRAIRKNLRQSYHRKADALTDADAEELYQLDLQSKQTELDLHKQYAQKLRDIIGAKKLVLLRVAEEQFKREMINNIRDKNE